MIRRPLALLAGVVVAATLLAGCASGGSAPAPTPTPSAPSSASAAGDVAAAWLDGGSMIALLTWGSSSCKPMATDAAYADGTLKVALSDPATDQPCTRDLVMRGIPVVLPDGVDPSQDLTIVVTGDGYSGEAVLAGVAGLVPGGGLDTGATSAGWTGEDGTFAILTWGSSSCPPQIGSAVLAKGTITVTEADPPADRICTLDLGPRVTVVTVPGVESGASYDLVWTASGTSAETIPIAGVAA